MKKRKWSFGPDMKRMEELEKQREALREGLEKLDKKIERLQNKLDDNIWIFDKLVGKKVEFVYNTVDETSMLVRSWLKAPSLISIKGLFLWPTENVPLM